LDFVQTLGAVFGTMAICLLVIFLANQFKGCKKTAIEQAEEQVITDSLKIKNDNEKIKQIGNSVIFPAFRDSVLRANGFKKE
jgi:hypothetical protein